jgi:hypothetical protein
VILAGLFRRYGVLSVLSGAWLAAGCGKTEPPPPVIPTVVAVAQGQSQNGLVNTALPTPPAVSVRGSDGRAAAGVPVTFTVLTGGGTVTGGSVTTNSQGVAIVGSWILGSSTGTNTMMAVAEGVDSVTFTANSFISLFDIQIRYMSGTTPTPAQQAVFTSAVNRWQTMVIGEQPNIPLSQTATSCFPAIDETVDDLVIFVQITPIDGDFGVLAVAGPCLIRNSNNTPVVGGMTFDIADLIRLENSGQLEAVVLHEMGHVLGIGALWDLAGLLQGSSLPPANGLDPFFNGSATIAAFDRVGGTSYTGAKVPVANVGGEGSADAHWREGVLQTELMTPVINNGANPLSEISVASLMDLGYTVNLMGVDAYTLPPPSSPFRSNAIGPAESLVGDRRLGPIYRVDQFGNLVGVFNVR